MDEGIIDSSGLKIGQRYNTREVLLLCEILKTKYNLSVSIISRPCTANEYSLKISKNSMSKLSNIVGPHMHPSMYYKLNTHL